MRARRKIHLRISSTPLRIQSGHRGDSLACWIAACEGGSAQPILNKGDFCRLSFLLPPLATQHEVASLAGVLDDKIELNRRINRTLEVSAAALFRSWFVDFDPVVAKAEGRRAPGVPENVHATMPSTFQIGTDGSIPEGWASRPLGELVTINARQITRDYPHEIIAYLDISSVDRGRSQTPTPVVLSSAPSRARRLVAHGDVIWSCVRPNHRSYLHVLDPAENLVVSTGFAVLSPHVVPSSFLYMHVTTEDFVDYLTGNAEGSAYPAVRPEAFARASVLTPSASVAHGFDQVIAPTNSAWISGAASLPGMTSFGSSSTCVTTARWC